MKPQFFLTSLGDTYVEPGLRPTYLETLEMILSDIVFNSFKSFYLLLVELYFPYKISTMNQMQIFVNLSS